MKNTSPLISIIIVNWNGLDHLMDCLPSVLRNNYLRIEIIVVDNGSTDRSIAYLRKIANTHANVYLIKNKRNLGFAGGNNIGFKKAKGELILLLNNDTIMPANFFEPLVKRLFSDKRIAAVQPKILQYPQKTLIDSIGSYFIGSGFLYHLGHNKPDQSRYQKPQPIFSMKGAAMLLRKDVLDKVGLFDDDYFAYFEETDLCVRILLAGFSIWYEPRSHIYHKGGQTAQKLPSSFVQYHAYKNRIYTYLKNFESTTVVRVLPKHIIMCLIVASMYICTGKFRLGFMIWRAIGWNIKQCFTIKEKRQTIWKIRKMKDADYLPSLTRRVRLGYYYHLFQTSLRGYQD